MDTKNDFVNARELKYKKALQKIIAVKERWKEDCDGTAAWSNAYEIAEKALRKAV